MVEKTKPAAGIENRDGPSKRPGILKKTTNPSLETVPEFVQSTVERRDSSLDVKDSERNSTPPEVEGKFKTLCEGVQNCLALFQTSLTELLCLKDELIKHALPPSLLLKIVLVTGKLFRSSSDLSVPITELVRMVKLYSTPWETKSAALKKLHEDYENKQRQLNVALQKLVLVGIQSERLAQERKVLNWEKLFSKVMVAVEKHKDGVFDDERSSDVEDTSSAKRSARPGSRNFGSDRKIALRPNPPMEDKPELKNASQPRINFLAASDSNESEDERKPAVKFAENTLEPKHVAIFDDATETTKPKVSVLNVVKFDEEKELFAEHRESKPPAVVPSPVVKMDKECWTHEPEYDSFLHLRIYRPECKKVDAPFCSVAFNGHLLKTDVFENEEPGEEIDVESASQSPSVQPDRKESEHSRVEKHQTGAGAKASTTSISGKKSSTTAISRGTISRPSNASPSSRPASGNLEKETKSSSFEEVVFQLPNGNCSNPGELPKHITNEPLRFAVHPGKDLPMIAMTSVNYGDLEIMDQVEGHLSHMEKSDVSLQQLPLTSVVSARDMPFNSPCGHISVASFLSRIERPKSLSKSTETLPFDDLVDALIETRKTVEAGDEKDEVKEQMYSLGDMKALREQHAKEMALLQEEYETKLNELAQGLGLYPPGMESTLGYTDAATSPMYARSPSPSRSPSPDHAKGNKPTSRSPSPRKPRPKIPNLPDWGKDLPEDFLVRLHLFAENSNKYRQELGERTRRAIKEKYELQMAVQNRLTALDEERSEEIDVCLPAVFMPTRSGHVFSPKAHSYFHPTGSSKGRLTQPPSIFKLPAVSTKRQISVLNLFEMAQNHSPKAPSWLRKEQTRPHTTINPEMSQTAPPPPTAFDVWSPPPDMDRARTR